MGSDKGFLLTLTFVPKGLCAPALGLYTCIKALKHIPGPGVRWAVIGPLILWFIGVEEMYKAAFDNVMSNSIYTRVCICFKVS